MIFRQFILSLLVLVLIYSEPCNAQEGGKWNCSLNASSPFSYVAMIWDQNKYATSSFDGNEGTATMGSLVTCCALITTAYYYVNKVLSDKATFDRLNKWNRFRVIGQNIYDRTSGHGRENPCYQNVTIKEVLPHPKTSIKGERILFDFALAVMSGPFNVVSPTFPTIFFPQSTLELLLSVRYVNIIQSQTYCTLPTPLNPDEKEWIFVDRIDVRNKPFHTQCIKRICEQKTPSGGSEERPECERILGERLNATMLCLVPYWQRLGNLKPNPDGSFWPSSLAGSPLICNGTTLGMSNFVKARAREFYPEYQQDLFFTITLLRALPWFVEKLKEYTPVLDPFYIEDQGLARSEVPNPSRLPTPDWGFDYFVSLPLGDKPFPPMAPEPYSLAPATFYRSVFSKTLLTPLLLYSWQFL